MGEVRSIREKYGDFVLFPTSFGGSNPKRLLQVEREAPDLHSRQAASMRRRLYSIYVEFVQEFSKMLPRELQIVVRPHPSERESDWRKVFGHLENVIVTGNGDSTPWVLASKSTVQMGSTLALISIALEKHTFIISDCLDSETRESLAGRVCTPVHSPQELLKSISTADSEPEDVAIQEAAKVFLRESKINDSEFAVHLIADAVESLKASPQESPIATFGTKLYCVLFQFGSALKSALVALGLSRDREKTVHEALRGVLAKNEVAQLAEEMTRCTGSDLHISVKKLAPNLMLLEAK